jgi:hypothetical protein
MSTPASAPLSSATSTSAPVSVVATVTYQTAPTSPSVPPSTSAPPSTSSAASTSAVATVTETLTQSTAITTFAVSTVTTAIAGSTTTAIVGGVTVFDNPILVTSTVANTLGSLTGIVLCPSRTVNPTYTLSTPFPDDYTWGCQPGYICNPPQVNCNLEGNWPADTYYCNPLECTPVPLRPPLDEWPRNVTTSFYFVSPALFGLTYHQEFRNFLVTVFTSIHRSTVTPCKLCIAVP